MHFDEEMEPDPVLNRWTNAIIGAAIAVHKELGPGHPESIYQQALALEFDARDIPYSKEHPYVVSYRGRTLGTGRLDFLVAGLVVVELKSVEMLAPIHTAQAIAYLRATGKKLAIILNFNTKVLKDGIKRVSN